MLGRSNDLYTNGASAEENMRFHVVRHESNEVLDKNIYKEAAKRVVFDNCLNVCGIDRKQLKNFTKAFYYTMPNEQHCIQDCWNTRMKLHFGSSSEREGLLIDFESMKIEFQRYEKWNPQNRIAKEYFQDVDDKYISSITK